MLPSPPLDVADHVALATARLHEAGVATARADAEALACHLLGLPDPEILAFEPSFGGREVLYDELVARRAAREPLSHLLGRAGFRNITLQVGPGVFTPQPESACLVRWVAQNVGATAPLAVDLCTGAGTLALALANEVPGMTMHGIERDPEALVWARRNALARAAVGDPMVQMQLGSAEDCLPELDGRLDLVVSNPPYVATHEAHIPAAEVLDHDPAMSLWAGDDGLDIIRLVERTASRLLKPGGLVAVEHSDRQGRSAPALFAGAGDWDEVQDHVDHEGLDRFVTARRRPRP